MKPPSVRRRAAIEARGRLVARTLSGSWRGGPPPVELDSQVLAETCSLFLKAGVGGLIWRRIRGTDLHNSMSQLLTEDQDLDKLEWAAGMSFRAYGVSLRVRTNRPDIMVSVVSHLPPGWKATTAPARAVYSLQDNTPNKYRYAVFRDNEMVGLSSKLAVALDDLESRIRLEIAETSPRRVFVHAGVVAWRGRAIVLPGRSFSGKTTLVKELVRVGATYYSDEYAVLDDHGRVHPYARPLAVRRKGGVRQKRVSPESLGAEIGRKAVPVGLIVISKHRAAARWRPRRLSVGRAALEVLSHTVPARNRPGKALAVIHRLVSEATIIKSVRGEVRETARLILDYLDRL